MISYLWWFMSNVVSPYMHLLPSPPHFCISLETPLGHECQYECSLPDASLDFSRYDAVSFIFSRRNVILLTKTQAHNILYMYQLMQETNQMATGQSQSHHQSTG